MIYLLFDGVIAQLLGIGEGDAFSKDETADWMTGFGRKVDSISW